jgi:hypothetical protein
LLDPASQTGLSAKIAHEQVEVARQFASEIHARAILKTIFVSA